MAESHHSPSRPESSHSYATSVGGSHAGGGQAIFPGIRPNVDYKRLAEQNPLKVINLDRLAPSLRQKLLKEPNIPVRQDASRQKYRERIEGLVEKT